MLKLLSISRAGVSLCTLCGKELWRRVQWERAYDQVSARNQSCPCVVALTFARIVWMSRSTEFCHCWYGAEL